jgi:hypothetical protein
MSTHEKRGGNGTELDIRDSQQRLKYMPDLAINPLEAIWLEKVLQK